MPASSIPSVAALEALLDLCQEAACLVDPSSWQLAYANLPLRSEISPLAYPSACLFDTFPALAAPPIRTLLTELADGNSDQVHCDTGGVAPMLIRARAITIDERRLLAIVLTQIVNATAGPPFVAGIDALTRLADRATILSQLGDLLAAAEQDRAEFAILFVDVDGFKQVNDTHGHLIGDQVLAEVAARLAACVRAGDRIGRFGGDEFLILLERVGADCDVEPVMKRIRAAFAWPIALPQGSVMLSVSIGTARSGIDGNTLHALIDAADRAMYAVKGLTG